MIECFYYKDGIKVNNIQEIIHEFFKDNYQLRNAAIFSAEEIQNSTVTKIKNILGANSYGKSEKAIVTDMITKENPGLFAKLGIETKTGRLSPEYIEGNRIYQYVVDNLGKADALPDNFSTNGLVYTPEKLEALRGFSNLQNIPDNKLIYLLHEIEDIISYESKTKDLGTLLHNVIALKVEGKDSRSKIMGFLNDPKNAEILGGYSTSD